jgi:hypothetical protein
MSRHHDFHFRILQFEKIRFLVDAGKLEAGL